MSSKPSRCQGSLRAGLFLAALLVFAWASLAAEPPPPPQMVVDLNTNPINGSALTPPNDFFGPERAELGGVFYFAAADPMHGEELWRSDGTPEGTRLVRDIRPGPSGSSLRAMTVHQGRIYFFADDGVWGVELWSSDGTREGTRLVRDICPGSCWASSDRYFMASAGHQLFFGAGQFGDLDLWRTDGTRAGTRRVVDTCPGCFNRIERDLTPLPDGRLVFAAFDQQNGFEIWVSDGTPEGTMSLDLAPGLATFLPSTLIALGDRVLFWNSSFELWISDGTPAGSRVVRHDLLLPLPSLQSGPVVWKGSVYFANDFGQFWRTDGTPEGTILLRAFDIFIPPTRLTPLRDELLFIARDQERGTALWRTRGTPETTWPLKDPVPGPDSPDLIGLQKVGNRAFFFTRRAEGPFDLWVSNGKLGRTQRVTTLCSAAECVAPTRFDLASTGGGLAFFTVHSKSSGSELWRSDGLAAGTFLLRDIYSGAGSAVLSDIASLDGRALFGARTNAPSPGPSRLWSSDGTAAGTVRLHNNATWPQDFVRQGNHLVFSGGPFLSSSDPSSLRRQGLWRTDGTPGGTEQLSGNLFDLDLFSLDGDLLYLRARDHEFSSQGTGVELWQSDGTPAGTRQVVDIDQQFEVILGSPPTFAAGSSDPGPPVRLGPILLFAADDGLSGRELWATDGTAAGTRLVRDINPLNENASGTIYLGESSPDFLVRLGGVVVFTADDGSGRELWVTDGTEAGTRLLRDLRPGSGGSQPHDLVAFGGLVFFFASADGQGEALWQTDGTEAGTIPVKSLARQGLPSWGRTLTVAGNRLFFVADNEAIGSELHVSDGTVAGTRLVRQIRIGANGSYPQSFTVVDGVLVFAADDGTHGLEPWRSDGTALGTWRLGDLAPGQAASSPTAFTAADSLLFFAADDGVHGRELWTMDLP